MKHFVFLLFGMLFPTFGLGQYASSTSRPFWTNGYFSEQANSYIEVVSAVGYSEANAKEKAVQSIIERRSLATGQQVQVRIVDGNIQIDGKDALVVKARIIDQYTTRIGLGEYRTDLLVQTAKHPDFSYESVRIDNRYKLSARVFVPGMAQLHKGQTGRGILFIATEAAAIGGVVATEGLHSSYKSRSQRTHNAKEIRSYIDKADNMRNIRNGCIAGAVAIYAWNVIDGIVAKGKPHVVVGNADMVFSPYTEPRSQGLAARISF